MNPLKTPATDDKVGTAVAESRSSRARWVLPWRARRAFWYLRRKSVDLWDWIAACGLGLQMIATRSPLPRVMLFFGLAPGDDLLCTAVLRELRRRSADSVLMISNHEQLFLGNRDVAYVRPASRRDGSYLHNHRCFARIWRSEYTMPLYAPFDGNDHSEPPSRHIIADMCANAGIKGPVSLRPYLTLTEEEKSGAAWASDKIVIQSSGIGARHPMRNKEWYVERFQSVVDRLREEMMFVQLGSAKDPALRFAMDLRGATSIRETAAILHNARLFVGTVGFPMHLARAVECPSVIIFGGREAPWQSGYVCNLNLYSAAPCAPCWRWNCCDYNRKCMMDITVDHVVSAIRQMLDRPRRPLAVETAEIG